MHQKILHFILCLLFTSSWVFAQPDSVNMVSFSGIATEKGIQITWTTLGEHNVQGFLLERSLDAMNFSPVAREDAALDGSSQNNYVINDDHIFREHVYYRVTTLMPSGNESSNIIAVVRNNMLDLPDIMIYPTITSQSINIIKNSEDDMSGARLRVFNLSGHLLFDKAVNSDFLIESIDVTSYDAGAYIVELYKGNLSNKAKFIKQH